jgi:Family of unknown function (DUF5681)
MAADRKKKTPTKHASLTAPVAPRLNGRFSPGHSGNPAGRPKVTPEEMAHLDSIKALTGKAVAAVESVLDNPEASDEVKVKAASLVFDRTFGKPRQEIDSTVTTNQASLQDHRPALQGLRQRIIDQSAFERWKAEQDAASGKETESETPADAELTH